MSKSSRNFTRSNNSNSYNTNNHNGGNNKYRNAKRPLSSSPRQANPHQSLQKAKQSREKYMTFAREALASGDRVEAESYFQYADHYTRVINALLRERNISEQAAAEIQETEVQPGNSLHEPESTMNARPGYPYLLETENAAYADAHAPVDMCQADS